MARSQRAAVIAAVVGSVGAALAYSQWPADGSSPIVAAIAGCFALAIGLTGISMLLQGRGDARKAERLMDGEGLLARWRVSPADWERYRLVDEAWAKGGGRRMFKPTSTPPACGIDVFAGRTAIAIDGEWFALKDWSRGPAEIAWLPTDPECIEVALIGGNDPLHLETIRVPVPAPARAEARRVFDHWNQMLGPRTGIEEFRREWCYDPARGPK